MVKLLKGRTNLLCYKLLYLYLFSHGSFFLVYLGVYDILLLLRKFTVNASCSNVRKWEMFFYKT